MGQIELFNYLILWKQMTDVKLNCYFYIAILETICKQIKLLVLDSNTCNYLIVCKQVNNTR